MTLRLMLRACVAAIVVAVATTTISAPAEAASKPGSFPKGSVKITRGVDSLTISWPRIKRATKYVVVLAASNKFRNTQKVVLPTDPRKCSRTYCRRYDTKRTSLRLTSKQLSITGSNGNTVSSSLGNLTSFKVFALNSKGWSRTSDSSWKARSARTSVNWTPAVYSDMPAARPAASGRAVRIASFNVLAATVSSKLSWRERRGLVANQIIGTGATIVGVQEASSSSENVAGNKTQYEDLLDALNEKSGGGWELADAEDWKDYNADGVEDGRNNNPNQATRIYYKAREWQTTKSGVYLTGSTGARGDRASGSVHRVRMVSWARFQSVADPTTKLCLTNLHLHTNLGGYKTSNAQRRDLETGQVLKQLRDPDSLYGRACTGLPAAITGDFNSGQFHPPYGNRPVVNLVKVAGFVDTKNAARRTNTRYTGTVNTFHTAHQTYGTQIDYVLTKGMGGALEFKVNWAAVKDEGSDHFPVTATVRVPQTP